MTAQEKTRFETRTQVRRDLTLSPSARLLYMELDDYGGSSGAAWPSQATLAETFGVEVRQVQRWLAELQGRYVITARSVRTTQCLVWTGNTSKKTGAGLKRRMVGREKTCSYLISEPVLEEPGTETPTAKCQTCLDSGVKGFPSIGGGPCECAAGAAVRRRLKAPRSIDIRRLA